MSETYTRTEKLPMIALRGLTMFPDVILTFDVEREPSLRALEMSVIGNRDIFLVAQKNVAVDVPEEKDMYSVGVVCRVKQQIRQPQSSIRRVTVEGLYRARAEHMVLTGRAYPADVTPLPDKEERVSEDRIVALVRSCFSMYHDYLSENPEAMTEQLISVLSVNEPGGIANHIAHNVNLNYDERKYALAAAACKRVMDMQAYELFTVKKDQSTPDLPGGVPTADFPSGAGGIDPFKSYSYMFTGDEPFKNNSEVIWGRISGEVSAYTQQSFPEFMGGYNGMGLTQKMIDAYRMDDGRTIEEARADGDYKEGPNDFTDGPRDFSGYHLEGGIWQMYANREMRFYACVGFSGCYWPALSTTQNDVRNQVVEYCLDGNANKYASNTTAENYTPTGYVIKKYISSYDAWKGDGNERYEKGFPIIRYAEILLSYAEALNELTASHSVTLPSGETYMLSHDVNEIASAFNQVRYRAGLPGLKAAELNDRDELFEQIKRERMVEFLGEGRRFYDVRRWGIYEDEDSEPIMGLNIEANKNGGFYQRTVVNERNYRDRVVDKRLLFLPISKSELRKVPLLDQNPGYSD